MAVSRSTHARGTQWPAFPATVACQVEVPLPAALRKDRSLERGSVALVDVEGDHLKLRFLRSSLLGDEGHTLTAPEEAVLSKGGVEPVSEEDLRVVDAQIASAYQQLRAGSLSVEEAARRLGVNTSRIRQRLAERSLYGLKDGSAWLLPAFQFGSGGLVPGVGVVVKRLPVDIGALAVARWFSSPNPDLTTRDDDERALTPLEWLLGGNPPEAAAELAAAL
jgi:excisionase family DNA binding protein